MEEQDKIDKQLTNILGGGFCQVSYPLLKFMGPEYSVWISYIWDKWQYFKKEGMIDKDGWFYLVKEGIQKNTGIPLHRQTEIIKDLKELGILFVEKRGLPSRNFYKLSPSQLFEYCHLVSQDTLLPLHETRFIDKRKDIVFTRREGVSHLIIYKDDIKEIRSDEDSFSLEKEVLFSDENKSIADSMLDPTVVENKEVAQTKNKPLAKDSVAIAPENIDKVASRPTPRKVDILKKETKPTPKTTPQEVQELIQFWCGLGLVQHKNPEKKVYQEASKMLQKLMKAKFFESDSNYPKYADYKFTKQEIMNTFEEFKLAALNFNYQPQAGSYKTKLAKTSLPNFLYDNHNQKSLFIQFFEEKAILLKDSQMLVEDLDPEMTNIIKYLYEKHIVGYKPIKYDSRDENNFRKASNNLNDWFQLNKNIVSNNFGLFGNDVGAKRKRADMLFESIIASIGDNSKSKMTITSSWLCIDRTFSERLPKYLKEMGILT